MVNNETIEHIRKDLGGIFSSEIIEKCVNAWIDLCGVVGCNLARPTNFGYTETTQEVIFFFGNSVTKIAVCFSRDSIGGKVKVSTEHDSGYMKATFYTEHLSDMSKKVARVIFSDFIEGKDGRQG